MLCDILSASFPPELVQENFNEDLLWNFLCSCHFDEELNGPIRPVLLPVQEAAYLLVDNLTPHAGVTNNGPDAFLLHWYAYVRDVGVRGMDRIKTNSSPLTFSRSTGVLASMPSGVF